MYSNFSCTVANYINDMNVTPIADANMCVVILYRFSLYTISTHIVDFSNESHMFTEAVHMGLR